MLYVWSLAHVHPQQSAEFVLRRQINMFLQQNKKVFSIALGNITW